jgi:hypothetical protein
MQKQMHIAGADWGQMHLAGAYGQRKKQQVQQTAQDPTAVVFKHR